MYSTETITENQASFTVLPRQCLTYHSIFSEHDTQPSEGERITEEA